MLLGRCCVVLVCFVLGCVVGLWCCVSVCWIVVCRVVLRCAYCDVCYVCCDIVRLMFTTLWCGWCGVFVLLLLCV